MTDITELAQSLKRRAASANEFGESLYIKADDVLALLEALEKAQGMETYWKTQCRGITDHCEELQARIAELESHTVKPPVHPTVASENLDDETLQELIEFRRTTFEYHSKEGNKVQTIIHGVTLAALRELQERRKADSEPVAEVVSIYGDHEAFGEREIRPLVGIQQMPYGTKLYRHAQPAPVVSTDLFHTAASAIEDLLTTKDRAGAGVWFDLPFRLRSAANAQPAPVVPEKCPAEIRDLIDSHSDALFNDDDAQEIWNACRAAMLQAQPDDDGEPTDDERIMTIEGILNCERCGDEGWIVGEMGITRCACSQADNSPVITDG
ncbi:hypothetical protein ACNPHC_10520 [Klebsiella pneumoniae]|jgi:hypothetical protein